MKKTKLKLFEIQNLNIELNGYNNHENGENIIKGLLNEKLKLVFRYWLTNLNNIIIDEINIIDKLKNDLIQKYGTVNADDNIVLQFKIKDQVNPNYLEFQKEYSELLEQEKEIEHYEFKLTDLEGLEIDYNTPILFKLINNE